MCGRFIYYDIIIYNASNLSTVGVYIFVWQYLPLSHLSKSRPQYTLTEQLCLTSH